MTRVVIVAHQPLATALQEVARHVYPECAAHLVCVDIEPGLNLEQATAKVRDSLPAGESPLSDADQWLVLVDTLGATPARAARNALPNAPLVVGVNVPMLWRTLCYTGETAAELQRLALQGGVRGIVLWPDQD